MGSPFDDMDDFNDDIGLDAEDRAGVKTNKLEWYKGEKGRTDRAALLYFNPVHVTAVRVAMAAAKKEKKDLSDDDKKSIGRKSLEDLAAKLKKGVDALTPLEMLNLSDVRFKKMLAHYQEGLGYVISRLGLDGPDGDDVWKRLPEPRYYFSSILLLYPTNREGEIDKSRLSNGWQVKPWRFGPERYDRIYKLNSGMAQRGYTIASEDLLLECKDAQFQNIDINPAGPALYRKNEKFQAAVLTKALDIYDKLNPFREMSTADLRIKLGLGGAATADVGADDFGDILDNV